MPLVIDPFGFHAFLPVKQAVLLFGSALAALIAIVQYAEKTWRAHAAQARQRSDARSNAWLIGSVLALWAWALVVTPHALNPALHLGFGCACLSAHMVVFFAAMRYAWQARNTDSSRNFELLLGAVAIAALVMAGHAVLQAANADPLAWIVGRPVQESGRWRIFTTTGNPDWTAEFIAAAAPIAVWWISRFTRGAAWLCLLFAAAILPTGSRLGLAGLLVGATIYAWARRRGRGESRVPRDWINVSLAGLITLGSLALLLHNDGYAAALLRWNDFHSVLGRLQLWQASLHLVAAKPLHGYGLDHFALVLPDGLRAVAAPLDAIARSRMPDLLTAHAHNDFLEMGVETGIPGALLLLALFALGLRSARRALDSIRSSAATDPSNELHSPNRTRVVTAPPALAASLGVLFMLALASAPLHTPATALLFWLVLGCMAGLAPIAATNSSFAGSGRRGWQRAGSVVAICAMLAVAGWTGHRAFALLTENRQAAAAAALAAAGQAREAERLYGSALARAPWDHESGVALASLLIDQYQPDAALRVLDRIDAWSQSRESWLARTRAWMLKNDNRAALRVTEYATTAVPDFLRAQRLRAHLAARLGKTSEAKTALHQILHSPQRSPRARRIMSGAAQALAAQAQEES
ncbi:MAG TPA: O-antigen ligase family protein [Rhodanobacteraceae bacterium]|nr:O-antigen ligase family protein [Rhodanobacteraceae bacterium]